MTSNTVLRRKIVILFIGILCITVISFSIVVLKITGKAIRSSADSELLTQARHTAAVLDARMQSICTILESIAVLPALADQSIPFQSKARSLEQMSAAYKDFRRIYIADMIGIRYDRHGAAGTVDSMICKVAENKKNLITEPSIVDTEPVYTVSVPVYYDSKPSAVLCAEIAARELSNSIDSIQIGKTGLSMVIGATGTIIAHRDFKLVQQQMNILADAKQDSTMKELMLFMQYALSEHEGTGQYTFLGLSYLSAFTTMNTTGWTVQVKAPEAEYLFLSNQIMNILIIIGLVHIAGAAVIISVVLGRLLKQTNG